jgi:Uma2 family endonuclease
MATVTEAPAPSKPASTTTPVEPEGRYEVAGGIILEKPAMGAYEAWVASALFRALVTAPGTSTMGRVVSEMLFIIDASRDIERRPDLAFVSFERWGRDRAVSRAAAWDVVPDLAVEVVSPNNKTLDDARKVEDYFRAGARAVWLLFPDPEVAKVYAYTSPTALTIIPLGGVLDGGAVVPGFQVDVKELLGDGAT